MASNHDNSKNLNSPDDQYNISDKGITNDQIESGEISQQKEDRESGKTSPTDEVSKTIIDNSPKSKGNVGVNKSSMTTEQKVDTDKEIEDLKGAGDSGTGRAAGADRGYPKE